MIEKRETESGTGSELAARCEAYRRQAEDAGKRIASLEEDLRNRDFTISNYESWLRNASELMKKMRLELYGRKSEKSASLIAQSGSLFDEAELIACKEAADREADVPEEPSAEAASNDGAPGAGARKQRLCTLPADTPVIVVDHSGEVAVPADPNTGRPMVRVGTREEKKIGIIRKLVIYRHLFPVFAPAEDYEPDEGEAGTVVAYPSPGRMLKGCFASEELVADICTGKYIERRPLFLMEEAFRRSGVQVTRQDMAHYIRAIHDKCGPLIGLMREKLLACDLINMDETPHQVIMDSGARCTKSTFEVIQVGTCDDYRVVLYEFNFGRSADSLAMLLRGFRGALMTDGLPGYGIIAEKRLEGTLIKKLACWAHARRMFISIIKINGRSRCIVIVALIKKLYEIEHDMRDRWDAGAFSSRDAFTEERIRRTGPVFDGIKVWLDANSRTAVPGSQLAKSINYCLSRWSELTAYPEVFHATPDNNISERFTRPFSQGDDNWFFSDTANGARASSTVYTLMQNARLCGLNETDYLWCLLRKLPSCSKPQDYEQLLPWKISLSGIEEEKRKLLDAVPDPDRTEPYVIRGGLY